MSHSYVNNLMHCTFSTKERYPFIESNLESDLWPYVGGIARANRMKALAIEVQLIISMHCCLFRR